MEFDEHEELEEEEEEDDDEDEEEIGIRLPVTTATTTTYESSRATKMASTGGGGGGGSSSSCRYRECLKNHAVNIGGHAVDGCGEFMPAGEEGTLDALKCAACNCHRSFHRKEIPGEEGAIIMTTPIPTPTGYHHPPFLHRSSSSIPAGYLHMPPHLRHAPPPLALPSTSGGGGAQSREDQEDISNPSSGGGGGGGSSGRKRFRTKFSQEQKDKMLGFAERLGWRIQKHDEAAVQQFCTEICVRRHVLKVWMHNNKHTLGKKP